MRRRAIILVLDGVGVGEAPDAAAYGDTGSDTLGNLARALGGLALPNLAAAWLGNVAPIEGVDPTTSPEGAFMRTHVKPLDGPARREEVASMLAGAKVTEEARAAASKLISEVS